MSLTTAVLTGTVLTETVHARELPMEPFMYGLVAIIIFAALAFVAASYRDVANRHRRKAEAYAARHGGSEHVGH
jgi:hypothetical protein